jgi:hypothetical protein
MHFEKAKRQGEKSGQKFLDKAEDCLDLAKTLHSASDQQHKIADSKNDTAHAQHYNASKLDANADKLEKVSEALIADAIEVGGESSMAAERSRFRKQPDIALPASGIIPKAVPK